VDSKTPQNSEPFTGPFFVVGMGRSGTTLLRNLLTQNPMIATPQHESKFFPTLIKRFGEETSFMDPDKQDEFLRAFEKTLFVTNMRNVGIEISMDTLREQVDWTSWHTAWRGIMMRYAQARRPDAIWGDRTPGYHTHMYLLRRMFPGARFIHIVRDPRDVALSTLRFIGRSPVWTAHIWATTVEKAVGDAEAFPQDYIELRYEDLISATEPILRKLCAFLEVDFTDGMLHLDHPSISKGDTAGKTEVVANNTGKYLKHMRESTVRRTEEITFLAMQRFGYAPAFARAHKPLSAVACKCHRVADIGRNYTSYIRKKGLVEGFRYRWRLSREIF
jgi:hypothetical protein